MNTRRSFLKLAAATTAVGVTGTPLSASHRTWSEPAVAAAPTGTLDRVYWCGVASRLATPVLDALSRRKLKAEMPVEVRAGVTDRAAYTHLEALGRLLCGLSPWLELQANTPEPGVSGAPVLHPNTPEPGVSGAPVKGDSSAEAKLRAHYAELAREAIDAATDPNSPDFMNFSRGGQPLVDAAFLAQAMLRAPTELWAKLPARVQSNVTAAIKSSRTIEPGESNWKLFATIIEVFLHRVGIPRNDSRLFEGIAKHRAWYVGDGLYGDGPEFHWDYYNSFVIQPMLLEALDIVGDETAEWQELRQKVHARLTRWAVIQERLIGPDGSYPVIGRSIAYRCGAFQGLALAALRHMLPAEVSPAQARRALTAVIRRTLEAPNTWDAKGWLQIGLRGHQASLGEPYISTGSLYLCSAALLPLGLEASDPFWSAPAEQTTWEKVWSGIDLPADHAIRS